MAEVAHRVDAAAGKFATERPSLARRNLDCRRNLLGICPYPRRIASFPCKTHRPFSGIQGERLPRLRVSQTMIRNMATTNQTAKLIRTAGADEMAFESWRTGKPFGESP